MNIEKKRICRLCLKVTKNEFREIDGIMKCMFDILLLKVDCNISKDPIICSNCVESVRKFLDFKSACINTEVYILLRSADRKEGKRNIKMVDKASEHAETVIKKDSNKCRICMTKWERNNFASLDSLAMLKHFLLAYLPEMVLDFENCMICTTCRVNIEGFFKFLMNCLEVEEKIKAYCRENRTNSMGQIRLGNIKHYVVKGVLKYPEKCTQICAIKESITFEEIECVYPESSTGFINLELKDELQIKEEELYIKEEINLDKFHQNISEVKVNKPGEHESPDMQINKYMGSIDGTKRKKHNSGFVTKTLARKNVSRIEMYKCSSCAYEFKNKSTLRRHMLVHKDISGIEMYKCALCTFESKHKCSLRTHMFVHKDISQIKMYKCSLCAYEAKRKDSIQTHNMLVHRDASEIETYKCSLCTYEAKRKSHHKQHMLVHKDASEIKMYKCSLCTYESRRNGDLKSHMLIHKDVSEIKWFKCPLCPYKAKQKYNIKKHMPVHRPEIVTEIRPYKCLLCPYQAKKKLHLNNHKLVHQDISEITLHKCAMCSFASKRKSSLNRHIKLYCVFTRSKINK